MFHHTTHTEHPAYLCLQWKEIQRRKNFHCPLCVCVLSRLVVSDSLQPLDCSPPGSSVHGISQARILEWVAISFSRGSFRPWDQTCLSCIAGRFSTTGTTWEALLLPDIYFFKLSTFSSWRVFICVFRNYRMR